MKKIYIKLITILTVIVVLLNLLSTSYAASSFSSKNN